MRMHSGNLENWMHKIAGIIYGFLGGIYGMDLQTQNGSVVEDRGKTRRRLRGQRHYQILPKRHT